MANTQQNPSVKAFRQAIAIDERRRMFRLHSWDEPQKYTHNRFSLAQETVGIYGFFSNLLHSRGRDSCRCWRER
ncbi:phospholipase effector Tle1 domain-containing protein [Rhodopseudomonas sp. P2A-2r]|uniref:phospholipase effector Tle1 domain-containing protein n=1 Tax=Rhodopseudomonas sp. P2A-2r TaxID=2991972 RepID=UPI0039B6FF1D